MRPLTERSGRPAPEDLIQRRTLFAPTEPDPALGIRVEAQEHAGVPALVVNPGREATVLYLHGGGFRMGSPEAYLALAAQFAAGADATVVLPRYRLAPEHPFPSGLVDSLAVYRALAANSEQPLILAGDSAGAGLAASLAALAPAEGLRPATGLMLLSPWLDLSCTAPAHDTTRDPFFTHESARSAADDYLQGIAPEHPLASPLLGDLTVFPPTLVQVGTREVLLNDALDLAARLAAVDVSCTLELVADQSHTWPLTQPSHPDSVRSVAACVQFIRALSPSSVS